MRQLKLIFALLLLPAAMLAKSWYSETLYDSWRQAFSVDETLFEMKTDHQDLVIFKNQEYGHVLALDGIIQTTERDEFIYHEMMVHVPLLSHGNAENVLVIGGGDGGILREVLRHPTVEKAVLVEIDQSVIDMCREYFPNHSNGAFDDPRVQIVIQDGCEFVKESPEHFDVIICDSTDPIGPGEKLFTTTFYEDCSRLLTERGIFVCQNGVPFMQESELVDTYRKLKPHFDHVAFYTTVVPTYIGGMMTLGWATNSADNVDINTEILKKRLNLVEGKMKYYTPEIHRASFALPQFMQDALENF